MPDQSNPGKIWLAPQCHEESPEGRHWCEDDVWGECEHCGGKPVEYVRADLAIPADQVLVKRESLSIILDYIKGDCGHSQEDIFHAALNLQISLRAKA
ncbi:hypothetical protein P3W55_13840 [Pseudomonas citronellolis]|uniref:Uncharacterized protein n=1 Tax=Pseudomonas citronellolis TaxID=53408 RepID=A0AAW6P7P3_9PSED|nr:hypothetical protein [Pseudomonas citronellolis]MDF3842794.1 hypothetical protein [Pseudomonas citronellolis]